MTAENLDWTHKHIKLKDIRKKSHKVYVLKVHDTRENKEWVPEVVSTALFVKDHIFEERLSSYFFKDITKISRQEILDLSWNMYITKGYYIKINQHGEVETFNQNYDKWYISYLEIDGPLGTFESIRKEEAEKEWVRNEKRP